MRTPQERAHQDIVEHNGRNPHGGTAYLRAYDEEMQARVDALAEDARRDEARESEEMVGYLRDNIGDVIRDAAKKFLRRPTDEELMDALESIRRVLR